MLSVKSCFLRTNDDVNQNQIDTAKARFVDAHGDIIIIENLLKSHKKKHKTFIIHFNGDHDLFHLPWHNVL